MAAIVQLLTCLSLIGAGVYAVKSERTPLRIVAASTLVVWGSFLAFSLLVLGVD